MASFSNPYVNALQSFYNDLGEKYDAMTHSFHSKGAQNLVDAAGSSIQKGSWVLDLATGTGNVALAAAAKVGTEGRVFGIDISDKFLELASKRAIQAGVQDYVEFSHQDVMELKLPEQYAKARFDAVTCGSAIAMFPDPKAVVQILATKFLKPRGVFAVDTHGTPVPAKAFLDVAVPRGFKPPFDPAWLDKAEDCLRNVFEGSEFEIESVASNDIGTGTMKWDVSTAEATDKLWKFMVLDASWLTFGIERVSEDVLADIKQAWLKKLAELKNADGFIVGGMTQVVVIAALKQ